MKERLEYILNYLGITKKAFAEAIGLSASTITDFLKGRSKELSSSTIISMNKVYNINPTWFLTGTGEVFLNKNVESDLSKSTSSKSTNSLEGLNGGAEIFEGELNHTGWFRRLTSKKKIIAAALEEITDEAADRIVQGIEYELRVEENRKAAIESSAENKSLHQKGEVG